MCVNVCVWRDGDDSLFPPVFIPYGFGQIV